jgi:hypothetical protein
MPTISLYREPAWTDRVRAYHILVDGAERGAIRQKEKVDIEVSPGPHRVQLKVDFCSSPELAVDASGDVRLGCRSNVHPFLALYFLLLRQKEWIRLWKKA